MAARERDLRRGLHQARDRPALQPRRRPRGPPGERLTSPGRRPGSARSGPACPAAAPPSSSPRATATPTRWSARGSTPPRATTGPGARERQPRRRARGPHPRARAGHRGAAHPGARRDRDGRGADGVVRRRADGGRRGEVRRRPRPPATSWPPPCPTRRPAGAGGSSSCTTPCRAAPATFSASPTRPSSATCSKRARRIVADCPCQHEGKRACHRCLLGHISDDKFDLVSRAEALACWMSCSATGPPTASPATDHISLWDQVESELEARFAKALEDWAAGSAPSVLYRRGAVLNGNRTADLHISRPDGQLVHWQVTLQNTIEGTRPDVLFKRVDAAPLTVAVYLDGYAYHAAAGQEPARRRRRPARQAARRRAPSCSSSTGTTSTRRPEDTGGEPPAVAPLPGQRGGGRARHVHPARRRPGRTARAHLDHRRCGPCSRSSATPTARPGPAARRPPSPGCSAQPGAERGQGRSRRLLPNDASWLCPASRLPRAATARSRWSAPWMRAAARSRCSSTRGAGRARPRRSAPGAPSP